MHITPLAKEDIKDCAEILAKAFHGRARRYRSSLKDSFNKVSAEKYLVARDKGRIAGVIAYERYEEKQHAYSLAMLAVDETCRGQGIGSALVTAAEEEIKEEEIKKQTRFPEKTLIRLFDYTKVKNPQSRLYEKMGYSVEVAATPDNPMPILHKIFSVT